MGNEIFTLNFFQLKMVDYQQFDFEESEPRDDMEGVFLRKRIYAKR